MISGPALEIALVLALTWYIGAEAVQGAKWIGHEAKKAGAAIVHVLKKVPHP
jgi:hypothetical protein